MPHFEVGLEVEEVLDRWQKLLFTHQLYNILRVPSCYFEEMKNRVRYVRACRLLLSCRNDKVTDLSNVKKQYADRNFFEIDARHPDEIRKQDCPTFCIYRWFMCLCIPAMTPLK